MKEEVIAGEASSVAAEQETAAGAGGKFGRLKNSAGELKDKLTTADITIDQNKYLLSDKVKVYQMIDAGVYQSISLNDAISGSYSYTCYYDRAQSKGGRIRVIVCRKK